MKKVLVSTDNAASAKIFGFLAAEPDDSLALAVLLDAHWKRELELIGITSTFGNTDGETTYRICQKQVELSGLKIPVVQGAIRKAQDDNPAVKFIINHLESSREKTTLVGQGPVTDFAAVFKQRPSLKEKVASFLLIRSGPYIIPKYWYLCSFNAYPDMEAAKFLHSIGGNQFSMGQEIFRVSLSFSDIRRLQKINHPMMKFITKDLFQWNLQNKFFPDRGYFARRGNMCPRDLVWVMFLTDPELFFQKPLPDRIELHIKNTEEFHQKMMTRLLAWDKNLL